MKLKFSRDDVKAMLDTVLSDGGKVMIVKDEGVYLMSFDDKPKNAGPDWKRVVAYARGYNPKTDGEEVWEKSREAMGGDDGGDDIGTKKEFLEILGDSVGDLIVNVSATQVSVSYTPKNSAPAPKREVKPLDVFKGAKSGKWRIVHSVDAEGNDVLYAVAFAKKSDATAFVKSLKASASFKAMHDAVVARSSKAAVN